MAGGRGHLSVHRGSGAHAGGDEQPPPRGGQHSHAHHRICCHERSGRLGRVTREAVDHTVISTSNVHYRGRGVYTDPTPLLMCLYCTALHCSGKMGSWEQQCAGCAVARHSLLVGLLVARVE
eukprot:2219243-Pyramimonas_sp.AAC.1